MQAEVVHTPALLPLYQLQNKVVVVIDILRATTTMCVAFKTGVNKILPVANPDECRMFKDFDFIIAAERNAVKVPGFDMGLYHHQWNQGHQAIEGYESTCHLYWIFSQLNCSE
jgi:phosphosulfolactate phosphohydrolase-like enzyme